MADYYRASFKEEFRQEMEKFIENNPQFAFDNPKDLMKHATREFMIENSERMSKEEVMEWFEDRIFND